MKRDKLYRQTEANKNTIVFVYNWMSFWEAVSHAAVRKLEGTGLSGGLRFKP
jgi:hypothetical protein